MLTGLSFGGFFPCRPFSLAYSGHLLLSSHGLPSVHICVQLSSSCEDLRVRKVVILD